MVNSDNSIYITDLDFIPSNIREGGDYHLVYGVLLHFHHHAYGEIEYIYNLICLLCLKQKTLILRRIMSKRWITLLNEIIGNLNKYAENNSVYVEIPFCDIFYGNVIELRDAYEFSRSILEELIDSDFNNIELANIEGKYQQVEVIYPVKSMKELFLDLIEKVKDGYFEYTDRNSIEPDMVYDEMYARSLSLKSYSVNDGEENQYRKHLLGGKVKRTIVIYEDNVDEEIVVNRKNYEVLGTIYYMLKDALRDNFDLLVNVASFAAKSKYDKNNKSRTTAYKYFKSPEEVFLNKNDKIQYFRKQLEEYNCTIPKELQE